MPFIYLLKKDTIHMLAVNHTSTMSSDLKLNENLKAIDDCDECLSLDATNLKAHLRKAQALLNDDRPREAFAVYAAAKRIDAASPTVANALRQLRERFPDLPPDNARRIQVQEGAAISAHKPDVPNRTSQSLDEEYAASIRPTKIVPSKLAQMAETMRSTGARQPKPATADRPDEIRTRRTDEASIDSIRVQMPTTKRTEYKNGVIIEELN